MMPMRCGRRESPTQTILDVATGQPGAIAETGDGL